MTQTLTSAYQTHLDSGTTTLGYLFKVTRPDGTVFAFTSAPENTPAIGGQVYSASQGLQISSIATTAGFGVDTLELTTIDDGTLFTRAQVLGGVWQNSAFVLSRYNINNPTGGTEPLLAGTFGHVGLRAGAVVCELRGLQQYLRQDVGVVTSRTCRARFADYPTQNGPNRCGLTAATYQRTGTVSAVASAQEFTASALWTAVPTDDYYGEGLLEWLTGANAGMSIKVKSYVASGVITLMLPAVEPIANGDTFRIIAGCRKRFTEDCKTKHANQLNFQGEPDLPGTDAMTTVPEGGV